MSTKDTSSSLSADTTTSTSDTSSTHQGGAASQSNQSYGDHDAASPGNQTNDNPDECLHDPFQEQQGHAGRSNSTCFSGEQNVRSVYRRSDCAELNVWSQKPLYTRHAEAKDDQSHATSSQCDLLFDAIGILVLFHMLSG